MARAMSQNCSARSFELVQSTELVSHWGDNVRRRSALGAQSLADANVGVTGQALNCRKCAQSTMWRNLLVSRYQLAATRSNCYLPLLYCDHFVVDQFFDYI